MARLKDKVALVTGGSSGIGLATAQRFVEEGAFVYITGRRQVELDRAGASLGRSGRAIRADSANDGDLDRLYAEIEGEKGKLDVLVANAGVLENQKLGDITAESFDKSFSNSTAPGNRGSIKAPTLMGGMLQGPAPRRTKQCDTAIYPQLK